MLTQLQRMEELFQDLGIKYHRFVSPDNPDYVYIQKHSAHDIEGHIHVLGYGLIPLTQSSQLVYFFEFYKGDLVSW